MLSALVCLGLLSAYTVAIPVPDPVLEPRGFEKMSRISTAMNKRQDDWSDERNELANCAPVTVIFARGTTELGNVGSFAGPPFFNALDLAIGADKLAVQGVDYPASIPGYLRGGDPGGATTLANLATQAASLCPGTQIVLSGYSQGAQVVHLGAAKLTPEVAARVAAVIVFGDPDKDQPIPNIDESVVDTYCFTGDLICDGLPVVDTFHLSYSVDAVSAAIFVKNHVNL